MADPSTVSLNQAGELVESTIERQPSKLKSYAIAESVSEYAGVCQRWFLVQTAERRKSDTEKLDK